MSIRIRYLGRVGDETKGTPHLSSPMLEVHPKTLRRAFHTDDAV